MTRNNILMLTHYFVLLVLTPYRAVIKNYKDRDIVLLRVYKFEYINLNNCISISPFHGFPDSVIKLNLV